MIEIDDNEGESAEARGGLAPGALFAQRFRIESPLGIGGMGSVYRAVDQKSLAKVALKILKRSALETARFEREVDILNRAHHPGIIGIEGFGTTDDGTAWLAMEYVEGETLRTRVEREGQLDVAVLAPIVLAACDALTSAHALGVVHRDLKPDHVFLTKSGKPPVKILDFGLSLTVGSKKLTKTGTVLGTPRYMAPEQIASAHASDGRVDVYALGVIVYEALTGHSPFVASDQGQLLGAILQGRIEPLALRRPDLPPDLVHVVDLAMARSTDERWATPADFGRAFSRAARGLSIESLLSERLSEHDTPRPSFSTPMPGAAGHPFRASTPTPEPSPPGSTVAVPVAGARRTLRSTARTIVLVVAGIAIFAISAMLSYFALR